MNFEKWMRLKRNLSNNTIKTYLTVVKKLEWTYSERLIVEEIENKEINTRRILMFAYICYLDYLVENKTIEKNFLRSYKVPKAIQKQRQYATQFEIMEIHENYFDDNEIREKRTKQAIDLMFYFGLRSAELIAIKSQDIQNGYLNVLGKGRKFRSIPIPKVMINKYGPKLNDVSFSNFNKVGYSTIRKDIVHACKKVNLKSLNPHSFRHGYASLLLSKGVDILTISTLLGHNSLDTTAVYLHLEPINIKNKIDAIF